MRVCVSVPLAVVVSVHMSARVSVHLPVFDSAVLWCSAEMLLADGGVVAGAAKQMPFEGLAAVKAHAELESLLAMQGKPLLVQGLAAWCTLPVSTST